MHLKGDSHQDLCHDVCGEKGWTQHSSTGCCHQTSTGTTDLSPCHDPGSLSRDTEGSCQSEPQGCQPVEPCPPQSCWPPQQGCDSGKPRRRVEVSHVQPVCPPPVKIHRRPLQQYRPPLHCEEPECGKPRRRVDQCPVEDPCPPVILHPLPLQHRCPRIPCCRPPVQSCCPPIQSCCPPIQSCCPPVQSCCPPVQRCCPAAVPLPPYPSQHQQKQVTLLPPCLQKK